MKQLSASEFRRDMKAVSDRVNKGHEQVMVAHPNGHAVMLVDAADYQSLMETMHLLRAPANAIRLLKGVGQYRQVQRKTVL